MKQLPYFYREKMTRKPSLLLMKKIRKCSVCGKKFAYLNTMSFINTSYNLVTKEKMCFECAYWTYFINNPPSDIQIADGKCYRVLPFVDTPDMFTLLGGGGTVRYFVTKDFKTIKSNDVWTIGTIPPAFRDKLPDTGWFCDKRIYLRIEHFDRKCSEIGCFDRYKCLRFRTELELKNGAFNQVPDNWIKGEEHCSRFTDTDLVYNYKSPLI